MEGAVTLDTDEERINVPCIQTYRWKEKLAVLMLPRFQGSLQGPKLYYGSQVRDLREFIRALYEDEYVCYSLEYFQNFLNFKRSLVLKT